MTKVHTSDGVVLHAEETGSGPTLVFVHELGGDLRSFEPQVRHFSRMFRCITFNARGYPPSEVPEALSSYSQDRAVDDIRDVCDSMKVGKAHLVGVSMGGSAVLHFALEYPDRAHSIVVAGAGSGSVADRREAFKAEAEQMAVMIEADGMARGAAIIANGSTRIQHKVKDPRGFDEFTAQLSEHSVKGMAATLRGVQKARGSFYDESTRLAALAVPTLIIVGDEDESCLDPSVFLKRTITRSGLVVLPRTGHNLNLEEAALFNAACQDFFLQVMVGRWEARVGMGSSSFLGLADKD